MARAQRLKVYTTRLGFFEVVVAAPSQKKALDAFGTHQDLFKQGEASETDDPAAVQAALEKPGVVLRRAAGSNAPFTEDAPPPAAPAPPKPKAGRPAKPAAKPPPPDRSALDAAEKALAAHAEDEQARHRELEEAQRQLDARKARVEAELADRRRRAEAKLQAARAAYMAAGGKA